MRAVPPYWVWICCLWKPAARMTRVFMSITAVISISPLPDSVTSSVMIATPFHIGWTLSRRMPRRTTAFWRCCAFDTSGTWADTRTPERLVHQHVERGLMRGRLVRRPGMPRSCRSPSPCERPTASQRTGHRRGRRGTATRNRANVVGVVTLLFARIVPVRRPLVPAMASVVQTFLKAHRKRLPASDWNPCPRSEPRRSAGR